MAKKEATGVKIRKAKNPDMEFHIESKWGMRYPKAVQKSSGLPVTTVSHGLSVASSAEWVCLVDTALARVKLEDRDNALRALQSVRSCFAREPSCPDELRKCVKKW